MVPETQEIPREDLFEASAILVRIEQSINDDKILAEAIRDVIRVAPRGVEEIIPTIETIILRNPPVRPKLKIMRKVVHQENRRLNNEMIALKAKESYEAERLEAWRQYMEWIASKDTPFRMQRPEKSIIGKMLADAENGLIFGAKGVPQESIIRHTIASIQGASKFVLEHDWAGAFTSAVDYDSGEFTLPDETCIFEMRIDSRSVVVAAHTDRTKLFLTPFVRTINGWCVQGTFAGDARGEIEGWINDDGTLECGSEYGKGSFFKIGREKRDWRFADLMFRQIRAAAIALEAEVAEKSAPIRADYRRNSLPDHQAPTGYSYHVISVARRARAAALPVDSNGEPARHVRLHFRRGHWRHYSDHKTWIKWMLCGDPDLGFVDKHYRL